MSRGYLKIVNRNYLSMKQSLLLTLIWLYMEPFLMFLVLGYGVGSLIENVDGSSYFKFLAPGFILATLMHISFTETGLGINKKIKEKQQLNLLKLTPIKSNEYILGEIIWGALKGILSTFVLFIFSNYIGLLSLTSVLWGLVVVVFSSIVFSAMGMLVASYLNNSGKLLLFQSFIILPMYFLSGAFFPIENLPNMLFVLSLIFPLTHAIMIYKSLISGQIESIIFIHFAVLFVYGFIFMNLSLTGMNRILKKAF